MVKGAVLRDAIISAANNVANHRQEVDSLNVFPVPDGDTGTNMCMTMASAARELKLLPDDVTITKVADTTSSAMLRGARGNSGVILSLIFRGIAKGLKGKEEMEPRDFIIALSYGVEAAYKAVMKPTEGTILTVVRLATKAGAAYGSENKKADMTKVWESVCIGADEALAITPELLPVLKKAGVIDSGGKGLCYAFYGMLSVFKNGKIIEDEAEKKDKKVYSKSEKLDIKFAYVTDIMIEKDEEKKINKAQAKAFFKSIGTNVKLIDENGIITIHLATNEPGNAIQEALTYGQMVKCEIENLILTEESKEKLKAMEEAPQNVKDELVPVAPLNEIGFVVVAAGEGLEQMFKEIGADIVVSGGQTMNPSTEDILSAIEATPAKTVFVFPNNKNIIMAAEQAVPLSSDRKVIVLPTRTIPQGISAMFSFDHVATIEENHLAMMKAISDVNTAQVTFAARDSLIDGKEVKEGQILGMSNGAITVIDNDIVEAAYKATKQLCGRRTDMVTIFYGEGATEEDAKRLQERLSEKFSDVEYTIINGGQPVYHFIISIE
ncbi:MAG: DAK2 domain-containing protein [Ruminococcaceae bacterium]|nr:DAK2 domain-containing protein [Oscillospiraceae bacterium]